MFLHFQLLLLLLSKEGKKERIIKLVLLLLLCHLYLEWITSIDHITFFHIFRPLELFRRCDARADKAAKELYHSWKNGHFSYSSIPVAMKDIVSCEPESWKVS